MRMIPIAAALIAIAAAAAARVPPALVSVQYEAASQRFCVRPRTDDVAETTSTRIYRRTCLTEKKWNERGIRFARISRGERPAAR